MFIDFLKGSRKQTERMEEEYTEDNKKGRRDIRVETEEGNINKEQ
jgi:hypothetical protein